MIRRFAMTLSAGALLAIAGAAPAVLAAPHAMQAVVASQPTPTLTAPARATGSPRAAASTLANVLSVASNYDSLSYCALLSTGKVDCWGDGTSGQLGNGTAANSNVPVAVLGISDAKAVASDFDGNSFCAVLSTGHMKCWGNNSDGELGNGTTTTSDVPVSVKNITTATAVVSGGFGGADGFCALLSTEHLDCWGYGLNGELGNGTMPMDSDAPVAVHKITNATVLISGEAGYCALLSTEHMDCWGDGTSGQLGNGTLGNSDVPVAVSGITDAKAVASGISSGSYCALLSTGQVKCWGNNNSGQLGNGTMTNSAIPVAAMGITGAKAVASAGVAAGSTPGSFCAVLSTGHLKCWGDGASGQLGNGATMTFSVPVSVKNITTATAVIGHNSNFCAVLSTEHLDCWGYGNDGELGDGTIGSSDVPVAVRKITSAAGVISSYDNYCALLSTSHLECWGIGNSGQLGNGSFDLDSDVPVAVLAGS